MYIHIGDVLLHICTYRIIFHVHQFVSTIYYRVEDNSYFQLYSNMQVNHCQYIRPQWKYLRFMARRHSAKLTGVGNIRELWWWAHIRKVVDVAVWHRFGIDDNDRWYLLNAYIYIYINTHIYIYTHLHIST